MSGSTSKTQGSDPVDWSLVNGVNQWATLIHTWARSKGWYERDRPFSELIALIHSEASEALESWRNGEESFYDEKQRRQDGSTLHKPDGWGVELADILIRVFDMAAYYGLDLQDLLARKMKYNEQRPYRHGGKRA